MIRMKAPARLSISIVLIALSILLVMPASQGTASSTHRAAPPSAVKAVTVPLHPVGRQRVSGTVKLSAAGTRTMAVVEVRHLPPGARPFAVIHAGTCSDPAHLSASSLFLPGLTEDARGRATGTGRVHGPDAGGWNQDVRLSALIRFGDVIVISTRAGLVACGSIA